MDKSDEYEEDDEDEDDDENEEEEAEEEEEGKMTAVRTTRSGRAIPKANYIEDDDDDDDDVIRPRRRTGASGSSHLGGVSNSFLCLLSASVSDTHHPQFVVNDGADDGDDDGAWRSSGRRTTRLKRASSHNEKITSLAAKRKNTRKDPYEAEEVETDDEGESQSEGPHEDSQGRSYGLRRRTKRVDYRMVAPPGEPLRDGFGKKIKSRGSRGEKGSSQYELDGMEPLPAVPGLPGIGSKRKAHDNWNGLPLSMTGKDYDKFFGVENGDSSDEDIPTSRKTGAAGPAMFGGGSSAGLIGAAGGLGGGAGGALGGADLGAHRDAMGRMKGADALADIDPLGINMQIDFDSVGGLDQHIQQLKEMVSLPLLYPEVFQRFKVTPPRGVLFHGPPGTGKTLVARALAASCSSSGQQISFFMRKGADCLSKWVGEAERQLRLLFEEARASQPSIIFFDEIDGLAPVRSSKQDQIHASIVSTLLALMDGMDGRGQVVVIGATNRPDSVDPALRRPGRFDREFYFPLPNREARKSIINIQTREWEPPLEETFKDRLAEVTKGYGGADLRALCTEAALSAIQRRYPQIYQTTERLELRPETIQVDAKDFMMSVNKVVPSSARSSSSAAAPLAEHLRPLLGDAVVATIQALDKVMPPASKRNPLEEALWEDDADGAEDGGFGREMLLQTFEQLRVFRPRLIIHGKRGMGQGYTGAALLHHLEGYHVQSLDVASLMGDSATTSEAVVIQMFTEAKRHKPSVLFIPGLSQWATHVSESVRSTVKTLLDGLLPSDPVTLVAISDGPFYDLPRDIRSWFGYLRDNRVEMTHPSLHHRETYFEEVLRYATKPPNEFPDAVPKRKRVLEELPIAPPRAPRVPSAAELRQQAADDARLLEHLKFRLGPVLAELKKKFPRFKRDVWQEYNLYELTQQFEWRKEKNKVVVTLRYEPDSELLRRLKANSPEANGENGLVGSHNVSRGASAEVMIRLQPPTDDVPASQGSVGEPLMGRPESDADVSMTNGNNGDHSPKQSVETPPLTGLAAAMTGDFSTANPPPANSTDLPSYLSGFSRDDAGFYQRYLTIWTISLEKMQKRLYYNGYLTVPDFLDDITRMVSNAKEAQEVDEERLTRAHQLHNLAVILLDQYIDADFRTSCERMAERMLQREEEARKSEEEMRLKQEEEARRPRMPSGERHSARIHGEAAEVSTLADLSAIERKRSRRPSEEDAGGADEGLRLEDGDGQSKRSRTESVPMGLDADHAMTLSRMMSHEVGTPLPAHGVAASEVGATASPGFATPHQPPPSASVPPYAHASVISPILHATITSTSTPQPPTYPPFQIDNRALDQLRSRLLHQTSHFNVEQLEQLRAALFDAIWRRRTEWDRDGLIKDMQDALRDIGDEVDAERREELAEEHQ